MSWISKLIDISQFQIKMAKTSSYLTVLCILFIAYLAGITDACMCMPEHPQTKYCKADYGEWKYFRKKH